MAKQGENLNVTCPCCQAKLVIDPVFGAVLSHEAHVRPGPGVDLTKASDILEEQKRQREDKFADSFFVCFLKEGICELVFALPLLLFEDVRCLGQVHARPGSYVRFVREHCAKNRINHQLGLAARASNIQVFALLRHARILLFLRCNRFSNELDALLHAFSGRVHHNALTIPCMVFARNNLLPSGQPQSGDIGLSRFRAFSVLIRIGTHDLNFDHFYARTLRDFQPTVACDRERIDGVRDYRSADTQVIHRDGVRYAIAHVVHRVAGHTAISERLLNRVNPQMDGAELASQFAGNCSFSGSGQAPKHNKHVSTVSYTASSQCLKCSLHEKKSATRAPFLCLQKQICVYALAGFSPRVKPGAGRNSGRTVLGSTLGAGGAWGGGVRGLCVGGVPFMSSFTSEASMTSRSSNACATRSRTSRLPERMPRAFS